MKDSFSLLNFIVIFSSVGLIAAGWVLGKDINDGLQRTPSNVSSEENSIEDYDTWLMPY